MHTQVRCRGTGGQKNRTTIQAGDRARSRPGGPGAKLTCAAVLIGTLVVHGAVQARPHPRPRASAQLQRSGEANPLDAAERAFLQSMFDPASSPAAIRFRRALHRAGLHVHQRRGTPGVVALRQRLAALVDLNHRRHHGVSVDIRRELQRLAREVDRLGRSPGDAQLRSLRQRAARIGATLRTTRRHPGVWPALERWQRIVSKLQFARALLRGTLESSAEIEMQMTPQVVQLLELVGISFEELVQRAAQVPRVSRLEAAEQAARRREYEELAEKQALAMFGGQGLSRQQAARLRELGTEEKFDSAMHHVDQLVARGKAKLSWTQAMRVLTPSDLQALLWAVLRGSQQNFWTDRRIALLQVRRGRSHVDLRHPVRLDGRIYRKSLPPGTLDPPVEFQDRNDIASLRKVELHRRRTGLAAVNSTESARIARALGSEIDAQHLHVTFRERRPRDLAGRLLRVDHWRRANLFLELLTTAEYGLLYTKQHDGVLYFDQSSGAKLVALARHLRGERDVDQGPLKMNHLGYRWGIYSRRDGTPDPALAGYEVRQLNDLFEEKPDATARREAFLGAVQRAVVTGHHGIAPERFASWLDQQMRARRHLGAAAETDLLMTLHYRPGSPVSAFLNDDQLAFLGTLHATDLRRGRIRPWIVATAIERYHSELRRKMTQADVDNQALYLLAHDWSNDTIWLGVPAREKTVALQRIRAAQFDAARDIPRWAHRPDEVHVILANFVRSSGLLYYTARSLDMEPARQLCDMPLLPRKNWLAD
jgi:hypothetical protein